MDFKQLLILLSLVALLSATPPSSHLEDSQPDVNSEGREIVSQRRVKKSVISSESPVPIIESDAKTSLPIDSSNIELKKGEEKTVASDLTVDAQSVNPDVSKAAVDDTNASQVTEKGPVNNSKEPGASIKNNADSQKLDVGKIKSSILQIDAVKKLNITDIGKEDEEYLKKEIQKLSDVVKAELGKEEGGPLKEIRKTKDSLLSDIKKSEAVKKFLAKVSSFSGPDKTNSDKNQSKSKGTKTSDKKEKSGSEGTLNKEGDSEKEPGIVDELMEAGESALDDLKKAGETALGDLKMKGKSALGDVKKAGIDFWTGLKKKYKINRKK